jgi:predicted transcriptional regulator
MPRKASPTLTDAELRLMEVLWTRGPSTVGEVVESLPDDVDLAYSTVLTTMRILEEKGYLEHTKQGRAFVYQPLINREAVTRNAVRHVLRRFFANQPDQLVLSILNDEELSGDEVRRLKKLIDEGEQR